MSKIFRIGVALLLVISMSSVIFAVFAVMEKEKEYMKRLLLEDKLQVVMKDKRRMEKDLNAAKNKKKELELQVVNMRTKIDKLFGQVIDGKGKYKIATLNWATRKKQILTLKEYLEKEKEKNLNISEKFQESQSHYENAKKAILKLEEEKKKLQEKIASLDDTSVELDKIVIKPSFDDKKLLRGNVLVVNKDYNFIVADLGGTKIKKGMVFDVRDGNELLAKAEIEKIYDTMSSLAILPGGEIENIRKGNSVIESR